MRIVIDASAACRPVRTGIARYTIRLVEGLAALAREETGDTLRLALRLSRWKQRALCFRPPGLPVQWFAEPLWPPWVRADLVHGTDARVPAWRGMARLATVHDAALFLFPYHASPRFRRRMERQWRRTAAVADALIADSEASRQDFARLFGYPLERIHRVPLAIDAEFGPPAPEARAAVLARHGLDGPYLLYVGELARRKNFENQVLGYAACALRSELPLVLAGPDSLGSEALSGLIVRLGLADRVRRLGYVPDADLPALYAGAAAFLFATDYEGFGMPVLEAMACGAPVVGGNRGAVPETAGGHAALVDPDTPDAIAAGIERAVAFSPAQREAARLHAGTFTWRRTVAATRAVYRLVTGK
jgi:glycosyltransferase involved in cell wall biosynthesis